MRQEHKMRTKTWLIVTLMLASSPARIAAQSVLPRTKEIRLYVAATFSPDSKYVYFVQTDLKVRVRLLMRIPPRDATFEPCRYTTKQEVITVRRVSIRSRQEEVIATLRNGSTMDIACGMWGYRHANLEFSPAGDLHYDISGPNWFLRSGRWTVDYNQNHRFDSLVGSWVITKSYPKDMPRARFSAGSQQIVYQSLADLGARFVLLVDHERRTVETLLATDNRTRKYVGGIKYQDAVNLSP